MSIYLDPNFFNFLYFFSYLESFDSQILKLGRDLEKDLRTPCLSPIVDRAT